jgi:prefoldin beta subunit
MAAQRLPPELENKIARYQNLQAEYTRVVQERVAVEAEIAEVRKVLKLLEDLREENAPVYKLESNILVRVDREKVVQELKDRSEILELRLQKLKKQEEELKKQLDKVAEEIRSIQNRLTVGRQPSRSGAGG